MKETITVTDASLVALLKIQNIQPTGYAVGNECTNETRGLCLYESTRKNKLVIKFFSWLNTRFCLYALVTNIDEVNKEYPELW